MTEASSISRSEEERIHLAADSQSVGQRLDAFLAQQNIRPEMTRSLLQQLIRSGRVTVNGENRKAGYRLQNGDRIKVVVPPPRPTELVPEEIPFPILFETEDLVVVSKPPDLVVHPACGNRNGTLVHGLLFHCDDLSGIGGEQRPGIVHRLDKDTSGAMVIAKNDRTHQALSRQFKNRSVVKIYRAIVDGRMDRPSGRIDLPIGRHPVHRKKMAVLSATGREAVTNWRVIEQFETHSYLEIRLETGRTHQIRVHLAHFGHPVSGDPLYGKRKSENTEPGIERLCLHAFQLGFILPATGEAMTFTAPLYPDIDQVLTRLRNKDL